MIDGIGSRLFVWLQYVLPQHAVSRLVLAATRIRTPWFKNLLTGAFLRLFSVDMSEAVEKYGMLILRLPKVDKNRATKLKVRGN